MMKLSELAKRFSFATAEDLIRVGPTHFVEILEAFRQTPENVEDTESRFIIRKPKPDDECDNCGKWPPRFIIDQRHPVGGSTLGDCCWFYNTEPRQRTPADSNERQNEYWRRVGGHD